MRTIKSIFYTLLSVILFAGCAKELEIKVEFNETAYEMVVGDTLNFAPEVKVENTNLAPVFTTSDEAVAKVVSEGYIVALAPGSVTVRASVADKSAKTQLNINVVVAEKIQLESPESVVVGSEDWANVVAKVEPGNYNYENLEWTFTATDEAVRLESKKVSASEYKLKVSTYVAGASIAVTVADKNSSLSQTDTIALVAPTGEMVKANSITLDAPSFITESDQTWGTVTAKVKVDSNLVYDFANLVWEFTASDEAATGFAYEKVADNQYKVRFTTYKEGANVVIKVTDKVGEKFATKTIAVAKKPKEGVISIKVTPATFTLFAGTVDTLSVNFAPATYDPTLLKWESSNTDVVKLNTINAQTVEVVAVAEGDAKIKVSDSISGKEAECEVKVNTPVKGVTIKSIVLDQVNLSLTEGENIQLTATCKDAEGKTVENYADLKWEAEKMEGPDGLVDVVEVSPQGVVKALNAGTTQVTVFDNNNNSVKATCSVYVKHAVKEVKFVTGYVVLRIGETVELKSIVTPEEAEDKTLTYKSSDASIATVSDKGVVKGVKKGKVEITATAASGVSAICEVNVVKDIAFEQPELILPQATEGYQAVLVYYNEAVKNQTVTWKSSDESIAKVDNSGKINTYHKEGTVTITATTKDDSAELLLTVSNETIPIKIEFLQDDALKAVKAKGLMQEQEFVLSASYTRKENGNPYYPAKTEWKSSDPTIATVDQDGRVYAIAEHIEKDGFDRGKPVTITHIVDGNEESITIKVVKMAPREIVFVEEIPESLMHGQSYTFKFKVLPEKATQEVFLQGGVSKEDSKLDHDNLTYIAKTVGYASFTVAVRNHTEIRRDFGLVVKPVVLDDFSLSRTSMEIAPGTHAPLTVTYMPSNVSYKDMTWTSSNENVATVKDGLVTAVAEGTAVITATHTASGKYHTCDVTVAVPTIKYNIGDYYYSTGKVSSSPNENASEFGKVVGVIFSLDDPTIQGDANLLNDHSEATHGLVVSLEEKKDVKWQEVSSDVATTLGYADLQNYDLRCGYSNTKHLKAYNTSCAAENKVLAVEYAPNVTLPETTSGWYLPSYAELNMLFQYEKNSRSNPEAIENGVIAQKIAAAGGTPFSIERSGYDDTRVPSGEERKDWPDGADDAPTYWSSTESSGSSIWATGVHFLYGGVTNKSKTGKSYYIARYIFAF